MSAIQSFFGFWIMDVSLENYSVWLTRFRAVLLLNNYVYLNKNTSLWFEKIIYQVSILNLFNSQRPLFLIYWQDLSLALFNCIKSLFFIFP